MDPEYQRQRAWRRFEGACDDILEVFGIKLWGGTVELVLMRRAVSSPSLGAHSGPLKTVMNGRFGRLVELVQARWMVHVKMASAEKWESFPSFLEELPGAIRVRPPFKLRRGTHLPGKT